MRRTRQRAPRAFCSNACYHAATIVYEPKECPGCGNRFNPREGSGRQNRTHCSLACFRASRKVTKSCPVCGVGFTVNVSIADRFKVCSAACKTAFTKYVDCERCGKRFAAEKRLNRHYCSEECRRPPVYIQCTNCQNEFRVSPANKERRFCSRSCYRKFTGETMLEFRVRKALTTLRIEFTQELAVGQWAIDFALTALGVALEADGDYWHSLCVERDSIRDGNLADQGWHVVRLSERDIDKALNLEDLIVQRLKETAGIEVPRPMLTPGKGEAASRADRRPFHLSGGRVASMRAGRDRREATSY